MDQGARATLPMVLIILTEPDPMGVLKRLITRLGFILFPLSVLFGKYYPHLGRRLTNSWTEEITGVTTQKNSFRGYLHAVWARLPLDAGVPFIATGRILTALAG